ncbi:MAG: PAS domain S-box protein [Reyranella sp.]|nr:MAG: PAS domain S-box protein [Reyranella sp.]TBR25490.1 MAG: PAS domain S-box protein [Reyranella sp.]
MLHGLERFVVPATYGIGVLLWAVVLGVLLARLRRPPDVNRLFFVLVVVLSIDAFRTLFENAYFGAYWNAVYGVLPSDLKILLEAPALVVLPRLVNLFAGGLILFLVVWRWLPAAETDRIDLARRLADSAREAEQARDRYQRIVDASPDLVLALDDSGHVTDAGAQFREVLGIDPAELPGKPVSALVAPAARAAFEARLGRILTRDSVATDTIETLMLHGDGCEVPVAMRFARVAGGGYCAVGRDLTAERDHSLLEAAVSHLDDMVVITEYRMDDRRKHRIAYVNEAFTRQTGYSASEAVGRTPAELLHGPDTDPAAAARLLSALEDGKSTTAQLLHYARDGRMYWAEVSLAPIRDLHGRLTHYTAIIRDVTRHKEALDALAVSEERLRIIASMTSDLVWDWNIPENTVWRSGLAAVTYGYQPEETADVTDHWRRRIHPDDLSKVLEGAQAVIDGGGDHWCEEYRLLRADGTYGLMSAQGKVIRNAEGQAIRLVGSGVDITERKAREEAARQSQKLEAIGQLTGGVAHDFNNILMVIMANADAVIEETADGSATLDLAVEHLKRINGAAARAAKLTHQLLAFSRRQTLTPERLDIAHLVTTTSELLARTLGEHIAFETSMESGLPAILTDRPQLETAFLNICLNARDAMPAGGTLTVATRRETRAAADGEETEYVVLSVTDSGTGMTPEVRDRVFEPFFTTKEAGRGSGLGLSMVYGFVKQSKGLVEIESVPAPAAGHGTTVRMLFPLADEKAIHAKPESGEEDLPGGTERILVVEDEASVRVLVVSQLERLGYRVTEAGNGSEALSILRRDTDAFDLLLTDVVMPGPVSGDILLDEVRRLCPGLPVVLMSGYPDGTIPAAGQLPPGQTLLSKPFRKAQLARVVRRALAEARESTADGER